QHPQRQPRIASGDLDAQRYHADAAVSVGCRQLSVETPCDRVHLGLGLLKGYVRPKASNNGPETRATRAAMRFPIPKHRVRLPHIGIDLQKLETWGEDADDLSSHTVDVDRRAYRIP